MFMCEIISSSIFSSHYWYCIISLLLSTKYTSKEQLLMCKALSFVKHDFKLDFYIVLLASNGELPSKIISSVKVYYWCHQQSYYCSWKQMEVICNKNTWLELQHFHSTNMVVSYYTKTTQRPWVRFWGPKIAAASCTHLGPAQVMEVIIIDV